MLNKIKILLPVLGFLFMSAGQVNAQCATIELCNESGFSSKAIVTCDNGDNRKVNVAAGECVDVKGCNSIKSVEWQPKWTITCSGAALPQSVKLNCGDDKSFKCKSGNSTTYFNFELNCGSCSSTFSEVPLY